MLLIKMVNGDKHEVPLDMAWFDARIDDMTYDRLLNRFSYLDPRGRRISIIYRHIVSVEEM
jgi:hypothetical protein